MALNIFLNRLERDTIHKILKIVIYLLYRKTPLNQEMIIFISKISEYYHFNDEEFDRLFLIDVRYELKISDIIAYFSKEESKMLLFFLVLFDEIFDDLDLDKIYKQLDMYKKLPISKDMQKKIIKATRTYIQDTIIMHYFIYDKELPFYAEFSKACSLINISDEKYKHFFLVDREEINSLTKKEKLFFLKALETLMSDDGQISELESIVIDIWKYYMGVDVDNSIEVTTKPKIDKLWLKNMLLFSYLITQKNREKSLKNAKDILGISHSDANKLLENVLTYYDSVKSLYSLLFSKKLIDINEDKAKNMDIFLEIGEALLMVLPQGNILRVIKGINLARRGIGGILENQNRTTVGTKLLQDGSSNRLIIVIDGFLSEEINKEFDDWMATLKRLYLDDRIEGFSWNAHNINTSIKNGLSTWSKALQQTPEAAKKLSRYIINQKDTNPNLEITLMGHSLGARVIFYTLYELLDSSTVVDNIILLGGAVDKKALNWTDISSAVKNIYNFYSHNDAVLKNLYQLSMLEIPIGLSKISIFKIGESQQSRVYNYDVSHIIGGHNEYKPKLYELLKEYNIKL